MIKTDEISDATSCLNRARDTEMLFVLLGRDITAPATIRFWVSERLRLHRNEPHDLQILEALAAAKRMECVRSADVSGDIVRAVCAAHEV